MGLEVRRGARVRWGEAKSRQVWTRRGRGSVAAGLLTTVAGALALVVALAAVFVFAATLAMGVVLAIAMTGLTALALRLRPQPSLQRVRVRTAPGHAWIAYADRRR